LQVKQFAEVTSLLVILVHTEWLYVAPYTLDKSKRGYSDLFSDFKLEVVICGICRTTTSNVLLSVEKQNILLERRNHIK